jgi:hypothetical protein
MIGPPSYSIDDKVEVLGKESKQWHRGRVIGIEALDGEPLAVVQLVDPEDTGEVMTRLLWREWDLIRQARRER